MPNWCENNVRIAGDVEVLHALMQAFRDGKLFDHVVPMPPELLNSAEMTAEARADLEKKHGFDSWYDWRVTHWGCKWDVSPELGNLYMETENGVPVIKGSFLTAWAPPIRIYDRLAFKKMDVTAMWYESGMQIAGIFLSNADGSSTTQDYDVPETARECRMTLPEPLLTEFSILDRMDEASPTTR